MFLPFTEGLGVDDDLSISSVGVQKGLGHYTGGGAHGWYEPGPDQLPAQTQGQGVRARGPVLSDCAQASLRIGLTTTPFWESSKAWLICSKG